MNSTHPTPRADGSAYRITVASRVGESWERWFGADAIRPGDDTTEIVVRVADQAELFGRLRRVQDLNLRLLEVVLLAPDPSEEPDPGPRPGDDPSHFTP